MKRICSILLAGCLLMGLVSGCSGTPDTVKTGDFTEGFAEWEPFEEDPTVSGMQVALENDRYRLSVETETGDFAVTDKQTGQIIHSNPLRVEELVVDEETGNQTIASVVLQYYDRLYKEGNYNTIDDCLPYGQVQCLMDEGEEILRIVYTLGKDNEKDILPITLSVEAYEEIVNALSSSDSRTIKSNYMLLTSAEMTNGVEDAYLDKAEYLRLYPNLKTRDLYVLRDISDAKKRRVKEALEEYGFTYEDVVEQREIAGMVYVDDSIKFAVPVDLTLTADGFEVAVEPTLIQATEDYIVKSLELYPGMGATTESGHFLVPDGSGALIPLQAIDTVAYAQRVYGEDEIRVQGTANQSESVAVLPCYAIMAESGTLFADITAGAAAATIQATPMGGFNSYAFAGVLFTVTETDNRASNADAGEVETLLVAKRSETGRLAVHYAFSNITETYSSLAVAYRNRLTAAGLLQKKEDSKPSMLLDLYGMMQQDSSVMGIPVTKNISLTTFEQAQVILKALKEGGVDAIQVRYLGMANGGLQNSVIDKLRIESLLGGEKGWRALAAYAQDNGVVLYPDAPVGYVYTDGWLDSFSKSSDGCRLISGQMATLVTKRPVDGKATTDLVHYALSATSLRNLTDTLLADLHQKQMKAVSFSTVGQSLNSNFNRKDFSGRVDAQKAVTELLAGAKEKGMQTMVETGHLYTLRYADVVVDLPSSSSGLAIESHSIPFAQMVMNGSVDYALRAFNSTSDRQWERLRAIETGSLVYYRFMYEDNILLKKSDYEDLNSIQYSVWLEQAVESYLYVSEAQKQVQGAQIIDHRYLTEEVTCTTYDNGVAIYVNYSDQPYTAGTITVPAGGYTVGGAQ